MGFDEVIDRTRTDSSRWRGRGDTLALTTGDADFRTPAPVRRAIETRLHEGVLGYDDIPSNLVHLIHDRLLSFYGWQIDEAHLVFLPGVVPGLNVACQICGPPGAAVISETPVYYPFLDAPGNAGCELRTFSSVLQNGRWQFDFDAFARVAQSADTHLFLLCHPQNPLGRVLTRTELERISAICLENDVVVCSDEIHCDLLFSEARHIPIASLGPEIAGRSITLMSPSKAFGMSGLGGAFAIIPDDDLRVRFERACAGVMPNINVVSLAAMQAAYAQCDDYIIEQNAYLQANRDYLVDAISAMPGVALTIPEATYFLWLDFRHAGLDDPYNAFLEAGLELSIGERFQGEGFLRLNFASPRSRLEQAITRMGAVLAEWPA